VIFSGPFKKGISPQNNTITQVLNLMRKSNLLANQNFKINVQKNIPHGSGLGGGSSNAANLLNALNLQLKLKLSRDKLEKIANQIGFDVPINLEKKNTFLTGKKNEILRLNRKFKLNVLIIYPQFVCSTRKIYKKNKKFTSTKTKFSFHSDNNKKLINYLRKENNDLQEAVIKIYPKIAKIIECIKSQNGCYFSRITGSGSACIGIFSKMEYAIKAKKIVKLKYPNCWCATSKTI